MDWHSWLISCCDREASELCWFGGGQNHRKFRREAEIDWRFGDATDMRRWGLRLHETY